MSNHKSSLFYYICGLLYFSGQIIQKIKISTKPNIIKSKISGYKWMMMIVLMYHVLKMLIDLGERFIYPKLYLVCFTLPQNMYLKDWTPFLC